MAGPSESRSRNSWGIIYPELCASKSLRLIKGNGGFTAKGVDNQVEYIFTFNGSLLKAGGKLLFTLDRNGLKVFAGTNAKDLCFSVKASKGGLDVFLADKIEENCDFNIKGKWGDKSCKIYLKDSSTIIAQMDKDEEITVHPHRDYPNVDCAFIVALVVVLERIYPA